MRPTSSENHYHQQSKKDQISNINPPLKINKDSHTIKKSSSSSSLPSHRHHPVIIYTHSPKIIHTHPRDFMALVQKLTGLSRSNEEINGLENGGRSLDEENKNVITSDENCCGNIGDGQVNSCFVPPPIFEPPNPFLTNNIPVFTPNSAEFLCSNQPFYNYTAESLLFSPNIRGSISSSSSAPEGMNDYREF
ncbi:hypothetical protein Patl1_19138 [Pistacia atlantica]|uniref:Uncharacterized protein n=1 Tax=Pistacia atlantica TaxID=434234 RepID=A0ACC1BZK3_9ROSI|nr:hypothetical protein Patl1_19138 [Pistacia atlantica]